MRNTRQRQDSLCHAVPRPWQSWNWGEAGVFVTFEESPSEIEANMSSFGWEIGRWKQEKRFAFVEPAEGHDDAINRSFRSLRPAG
ncbi:hypothetical protein F2981_32600 (plasmid) [Sinorhizobium meliloti]|nr:hypothetical protein [Sinorhizobium meliloti]